MQTQRLVLVGGDRRAAHLAALLREHGLWVDTLGVEEDDERTAQVEAADALLFPYPFSVRGSEVPCLSGLTLHPEDVLARARPGALAVLGRGLEAPGTLRVRHYEDDETLAEQNAELSAEAAVYETMQRLKLALMDARLLVTGYGRFGRALARRLRALGAEVCVAARSRQARGLAAREWMTAIAMEEMADWLPRADAVLNTVPAPVLGERELCALRPGSLLLELASAPYGFDRGRALEMGLRAELLPGLPARYAPVSAARALKDAVVRILSEVEA